MKNNKGISFIIVSGLFVLGVFTCVIVYNLLPRNKESDSYYSKVDIDSKAKIESLNIIKNELFIETNNDSKEYCVKTTKSKPDNNNLCWKKIKNNKGSIGVIKDKKYYIWLKDNEDIVNNFVTIVNK